MSSQVNRFYIDEAVTLTIELLKGGFYPVLQIIDPNNLLYKNANFIPVLIQSEAGAVKSDKLYKACFTPKSESGKRVVGTWLYVIKVYDSRVLNDKGEYVNFNPEYEVPGIVNGQSLGSFQVERHWYNEILSPNYLEGTILEAINYIMNFVTRSSFYGNGSCKHTISVSQAKYSGVKFTVQIYNDNGKKEFPTGNPVAEGEVDNASGKITFKLHPGSYKSVTRGAGFETTVKSFKVNCQKGKSCD